MDVLIFRIRNYQGVIADYGPFTNERQATVFLKEKGWEQKGRRRFVLSREDEDKENLEGDLRLAFHKLSLSEIPEKLKEE